VTISFSWKIQILNKIFQEVIISEENRFFFSFSEYENRKYVKMGKSKKLFFDNFFLFPEKKIVKGNFVFSVEKSRKFETFQKKWYSLKFEVLELKEVKMYHLFIWYYSEREWVFFEYLKRIFDWIFNFLWF